jgi:hypothetical protein
MSDFSYQQPVYADPFFNYDQALPFSPTVHQFDQPFAFPSHTTLEIADHRNYALDPTGMQGLSRIAYGTSQQYMHTGQQEDYLGGMTLPSYPPASAKWDINFQPGEEGLPFDEALMGDFGAALLQAEEIGGW